MDLSTFVRGLVLGFCIAAPVGPIGVLCIRRTLSDGRAAGLATGLGAATADAAYGCVAAFGLTAVSSALVAHQSWFRLAGGAFLCVLGVRTLLAGPPAASEPGGASPARTALAAAWASTFLLTLSNPMTILSFAAAFAGLGAGPRAGYGGATLLVVGVYLGSAAWWLLLSGGVAVFRGRSGARAMRAIRVASGALIAAFGAVALWGVAR